MDTWYDLKVGGEMGGRNERIAMCEPEMSKKYIEPQLKGFETNVFIQPWKFGSCQGVYPPSFKLK